LPSRFVTEASVLPAATFAFASPAGPLEIRVADSALIGLRWLPATSVAPQASPPQPSLTNSPLSEVVAQVIRELGEYFAGTRRTFTVCVRTKGTAFQERVWSCLALIPYGRTWSYRDLAAAAGVPSAVRAVANAVAANPIAIVLPCHRIVRTGGGLGGYAGGASRKRWLLDFETRVLAQPSGSS